MTSGKAVKPYMQCMRRLGAELAAILRADNVHFHNTVLPDWSRFSGLRVEGWCITAPGGCAGAEAVESADFHK